MKFLLLESEFESRSVFYVFELSSAKFANKLYKKLRMLPLLTNVVKNGWVNICDIPEDYLSLQEFQVLNRITKYKITGVILMSEYEYALSTIIKALNLDKVMKKTFGDILKNHNNKILKDFRRP